MYTFETVREAVKFLDNLSYRPVGLCDYESPGGVRVRIVKQAENEYVIERREETKRAA